MKDLKWDDLHIFYHVGAAGGLSGAARRCGLSAPTIGRRMLALEEMAGQSLFRRGPTGYELTPAGRALHERVRAMQAAAQPVAALFGEASETPFLRLSAGTATAHFLADRVAEICRPGDGFRLHFVTTEATLDIAHREIDAGIRNRAPEAGNLASRPWAACASPPTAATPCPARKGWAGSPWTPTTPAIPPPAGCMTRTCPSPCWPIRSPRCTSWSAPAPASASCPA